MTVCLLFFKWEGERGLFTSWMQSQTTKSHALTTKNLQAFVTPFQMCHTYRWLTQWTVFCVSNHAQCRTLLTSNHLFLPQNSLAPSPNVPFGHARQLSASTHVGQGQKGRHHRQNTGVTAKNLPHLWWGNVRQTTKTDMNIISESRALYSVLMAPIHVVLIVATSLLLFRPLLSMYFLYFWLSKQKEAIVVIYYSVMLWLFTRRIVTSFSARISCSARPPLHFLSTSFWHTRR